MIGRFSAGGRSIGFGAPCFVVAEAGVNHNGSGELAHRLVDIAADAHVDAVKFQTFEPELLVRADAPKAPYQVKNDGVADSQLEMLRRLRLDPVLHAELQAHASERGLLFLSTPFDESSVEFLDALGVPLFKIPSGEITNWPLLRHVASKGKPVILSTGMSSLDEVVGAVQVVREAGCHELAVLHCVSDYPASPSDANLRAMITMGERCDVVVGYSDHTLGVAVALAAVALGACIIEKHFTSDCDLPGPDHRSSLTPGELQALVDGIRAVELALGDGEKVPTASELNNREIVRRSLVAAVPVPTGTALTADMFRALRPAGGIPPSHLERVVGRRARRDLQPGQCVRWGDIE